MTDSVIKTEAWKDTPDWRLKETTKNQSKVGGTLGSRTLKKLKSINFMMSRATSGAWAFYLAIEIHIRCTREIYEHVLFTAGKCNFPDNDRRTFKVRLTAVFFFF